MASMIINKAVCLSEEYLANHDFYCNTNYIETCINEWYEHTAIEDEEMLAALFLNKERYTPQVSWTEAEALKEFYFPE